jgi:F-box and leucine-rich repeat protein GRR1
MLRFVAQDSFIVRRCFNPGDSGHSEDRLSRFSAWVVKRQIAVSNFAVGKYFACNTEEWVSYLMRHGRHIHTITVKNSAGADSRREELIKDLCDHCPNVLELISLVNLSTDSEMRIAIHWKHLTHLTLEDCRVQEGLKFIIKSCQSLLELTLRGILSRPYLQNQLSSCSPLLQCLSSDLALRPKALVIIASRCPQLRKLYLRQGLVKDNVMIVLGTSCPRLMELGVGSMSSITDVGLEAVARNGALTSLRIVRCTAVTDSGLRMLAECCPLLKCVDVSCCNQLTDATLIAFGQHCHNLRELIINNSRFTHGGLRAIAADCPLL